VLLATPSAEPRHLMDPHVHTRPLTPPLRRNASPVCTTCSRMAASAVSPTCVTDMTLRLSRARIHSRPDRVEAVGGVLALDSPAGGGTRVEAALPLSPANLVAPVESGSADALPGRTAPEDRPEGAGGADVGESEAVGLLGHPPHHLPPVGAISLPRVRQGRC
jgi:hypothetical protein